MGELFDVAAPWILGLAFRILQDADEAEEVVGDVFVQVWRHIDQHDGGRGPLMPWILSIARNRSLDALRRRRRWWRKSAHVEQARAAEATAIAPAAPHEAAVPGWPLHREVHGEEAEWSVTDHLLAAVVDQLAEANWMFATVHRDEESEPLDPPQPVRRPGMDTQPDQDPEGPSLAEIAEFFS